MIFFRDPEDSRRNGKNTQSYEESDGKARNKTIEANIKFGLGDAIRPED